MCKGCWNAEEQSAAKPESGYLSSVFLCLALPSVPFRIHCIMLLVIVYLLQISSLSYLAGLNTREESRLRDYLFSLIYEESLK